ncbi:hypothetical protein RyT2_07670 [Pseudolactococcus yaeyamensis]
MVKIMLAIQIITLILVIVVPMLNYLLGRRQKMSDVLVDKRADVLLELYSVFSLVHSELGNVQIHLKRLANAEPIPKMDLVMAHFEKLRKLNAEFNEIFLKSFIFLDEDVYNKFHHYGIFLNNELQLITNCYEVYGKLSDGTYGVFDEGWVNLFVNPEKTECFLEFQKEVNQLNSEKINRMIDEITYLKQEIKKHLSRSTL